MTDSFQNFVTILYATETGTAQDVANRIARHCRRIHLQAKVLDMRQYPLSKLVNEQFLIFVIATTGSGQEPRSMTSLWKMLLRSDLPSDLFEDVNFAVFGLGDTSYEKFCWPAKKISRRMESLGASEICPRGEGDEQHTLGVEGSLDPWITQLCHVALELYPLPPHLEIIEYKGAPPARVSMKKIQEPDPNDTIDPLEENPAYHLATLTCNKRITAENWNQDVRHIEFSVDHDIEYEPGDVIEIHPDISSVEVEAFLIRMGWTNIADDFYEVEHTMLDQTLPDNLPKITTLRTLFTRYLNINAVPRRIFFELICNFSSSEAEVEKLLDFVTPEGAEDLYDYCQKVRRTIHEVLEEFKFVQIPIDYIFDVFPPLRPREFSICSSLKRHPREIHLCVAMVNYRTRLKIPRKGVCTSHLANLRPGDKLRVGINKGLIKLPKDPNVPIICVGPGTGVAPMRAVIEHRIMDGAKDNTLYFGCRSATKDQHYASEWKAYSDNGEMRYRIAPSRDGPEGTRRVYVQDLILQDSKQIWEDVDAKGAWICISGSSNKMPAAVKAAIQSAVVSEGGKSETEAVEYMSSLERFGRLMEESWS